MNLSERDKRALVILGAGLMLFLVYYFATRQSDNGGKVVQPIQSVERARKQLEIYRKAAATLPAKQEIYKKVSADLADREKGLLVADTAPQAQARLLQILREVAKNQTPPLEIRQTELGQARAFGDAYGEVAVSITMDCNTAQLVNFMAFLTAQPELIATEEIRFAAGNAKTKIVPVRLTVNGIVPRRLVPAQKASTTF